LNKVELEITKVNLKAEEKTLKELQKVYKKARQDVQQKIADLNARTDMQNLQSIVYQKKYQEAILNQINEALADLKSGQYKTVNEYLVESYDNGYLGTMYSLQSQGIPIISPINDRKVVKALTTDSKLVVNYYKADPVKGRLAENVDLLKDRIRSNLSRGIIAGKSWLDIAVDIATGMNNPFDIALKDAMRIARTEGHRVNQQASLDAGEVAKDKGADILKQWDSTMDKHTRPWHREADGQIVEWDEDFIVMGERLKAPSIGGSARNVCNCRCQLLQRARWALDEDELEELKQRAEFFGLDKTKSFEEYKQKYLKLPEKADTMKMDVTSIRKELNSIKSDIATVKKELHQAKRKTLIHGYDKDAVDKEIADLQVKLDALENQVTEKGKLLIENLNTTFKVSTDNKDFIDLIVNLDSKTDYKEVMKLTTDRAVDEIIRTVGGGDNTSGSCASVGLAYIGQKNGLDVLDFRDGASRDWFSSKMNKLNMWDSLGVKYIKEDSAKSDLTNGKRILSQMEKGKEYYLSVGRHASVVRLNEDGRIQYLELQSARDSGWNDFKSDVRQTLRWRFGCSSSSGYWNEAYLIDSDSVKDNDEFRMFLGYINTNESEQRKGSSGTIK
jgi:hypothetical protein